VKKVNMLVISGSPHEGGNTEIMVDAFAKGAHESGNTVVVKKLSLLKVAPCKDCEYCLSHSGTCSQDDGMNEIFGALDKADMLVFASPIYWFNVTAQMKAVIDRLFAHVKTGYHPTCTALLLDSGSPDVYGGVITAYREMDEYLHWKDMGIITISGMESEGAMKDSPELEKVTGFGRSLK
jgi:multimeric flavodoxin WrbA